MRGCTVWLTGLPSAGKTTLAALLSRELLGRRHLEAEVLDGDVVRTHLSKGLGFSRADRDANVLRIGWVCQLLARHGVTSIVAAVSPYRAARQEVRAMVEKVTGPGGFVEVWVKCPLEVCMQRDVKGLYARAARGEVQHLTGVSDPYEEPLEPDLVLETDQLTPHEAVALILPFLERR